MRYFLELSYKGTLYNGWQRQNNAPSVQQTLEEALSTLLREEIKLTGAGRTDTGVHASYYVAHFDCLRAIESPESFTYHLNSILPHDIAARRTAEVATDAHARFDALEREYEYYILDRKDPFRRETSWQCHFDLNAESMNRAAKALLAAEDFTTFSKLHSNNKTNICNVTHALWTQNGGELVFTIRANRFLRNMVRSIVGTLVDVGRGKISPADFEAILHRKDRSLASGSAPAQGLFLSGIKYSDGIYDNNKNDLK